MKYKVTYLLLILFVIGCSSECDTAETEGLNVFGVHTDDINEIVFPEAPIEILSNKELGMALINYFNIVKISPTCFYLFFSAFPDRTKGGEFNQNLYLATSEDGFKYTVLKDNLGGGQKY